MILAYRAALIAVLSLLSACAGARRAEPAPAAVREDAFPGGKITMATIEDSTPREAAVAVGVVALRNNSADPSLEKTGAQLADLLSAELSKGRGFRVLERQRIEDLENELALGDTGPVDQATAARIGGMIGANVMAFGSFSTLGKKVLVTVRLVKVETGEVVGGVTRRADGLEKLDLLAESAAKELAAGIARK